jgi:hypothetical protein
VLAPEVLAVSTTAVIPTLKRVSGLQFSLALLTGWGSAVGGFAERLDPAGAFVG